jgi:hypothetical protein
MCFNLQTKQSESTQSSFTFVRTGPALEAKMLKADYHGAIIKVTKATNPCLINITGLILQETENTFKIVTKEDCVKGNSGHFANLQSYTKNRNSFHNHIGFHGTLSSPHFVWI